MNKELTLRSIMAIIASCAASLSSSMGTLMFLINMGLFKLAVGSVILSFLFTGLILAVIGCSWLVWGYVYNLVDD